MTDPVVPAALPRFRVFVDYWNFQLRINERLSDEKKQQNLRFQIDWKKLGPWLAGRAALTVGMPAHSYDGLIIYTSFDPRTDEGRKFHGWATGWLSRQAGIRVECRERKPKMPPKCPACYKTIGDCPHCKQAIKATQEKGVDTLIATDMIRLAWENAYDFAVLATSDRDLVPAVEFLNTKGRKVVHAGFPPQGSDLARASWASFDAFQDYAAIERASKT